MKTYIGNIILAILIAIGVGVMVVNATTVLNKANAIQIQSKPVIAPVAGDDGKTLIYIHASSSYRHRTISGTGGNILVPAGGNLTLDGTTPSKLTNPDTTANQSLFAFAAVSTATGRNKGMAIQVIPKGTGLSAASKAQITVFNTDFIADSTNFEYLVLKGAGTSFQLNSGQNGSGSVRPIQINPNGNPAITMTPNSAVYIGAYNPASPPDDRGQGNLTVTGRIKVLGNISTAGKYYGDGSALSGVASSSYAVKSYTTGQTISDEQQGAICAGGTNLLPSSPTSARTLYLYNSNPSALTLDGNGKNIYGLGATGASTKSIPGHTGITLYYNGSEWYIVDQAAGTFTATYTGNTDFTGTHTQTGAINQTGDHTITGRLIIQQTGPQIAFKAYTTGKVSMYDNAGNERLVWDSTSSQLSVGNRVAVAATVDVAPPAASYATLAIRDNVADDTSGGGYLNLMHNGASNELAASAARLGGIRFGSVDGSSFRIGATIEGYAGEAYQANTNAGSDLRFKTVPVGSAGSARREVFRVSANGNTVLGPQAVIAQAAVDGFMYIPTATYKPTGDSTDYTGKTAMVFNSMSSKICVNTSGSTWKCIQLNYLIPLPFIPAVLTWLGRRKNKE